LKGRNTDREAHAEDSSSQNVKEFSLEYIASIRPPDIHRGVADTKVRVTGSLRFSSGLSFYLLFTRDLEVGDQCSQEQLEALREESRAAEAYNAALRLCMRAEQSAFLLQHKLQKKEYSKDSVELAIYYLQSDGIQSDARFAAAFLRDRLKRSIESSMKLSARLYEKGISRQTAQSALDEVLPDFEPLLERAVEQLSPRYRGEKLLRKLKNAGFNHFQIEKFIEKSDHF
jgi:SOS response regulatory protein OraA/RecX